MGPTARFALLSRRLVVCAVLLIVLAGMSAACRPATRTQRPPAPTLPVRHRDALPLMLTVDDLGYQMVEQHRLERGKGWGEDTTRLSGYRFVFEGNQRAFTRAACQIECYMTIANAQEAYGAYHETLVDRLQGDAGYTAVQETEELSLGDWNRMVSARGPSGVELHYIFMRENVLVALQFVGPDSPDLAQQAARQARVLDERIYSR